MYELDEVVEDEDVAMIAWFPTLGHVGRDARAVIDLARGSEVCADRTRLLA